MALATGPGAVGPNTILQRVNRLSDKFDEALAAGDIYPGDIIRSKGNGDVVVHDQAGKFTPVKIALEDPFLGRTIDDKYVSGEVVRYHRGQPTDTWLARLKIGVYVYGPDTFLASAGDGTLTVAAAGDTAIAQAEEGKNASAAVQRIEARVVGAGPAGTLGTTTSTSTTTTT